MAEINAIAKQFTDFYYTTFDNNRTGIISLYRDASMLSWEGSPIQGAAAISKKLSELPAKVLHKVNTLDAQPSSPTQPDLVVLVTGLLSIDDGNTLQFTQHFHLISEGGSYYVLNDVFRLIYG